MEFTLKELNDLYYCLGKTEFAEVKLIRDEEINKLMDKILVEINNKINEEE